MGAIYDKIGVNYSVSRCTDPDIAQTIYSRLENASRIINIGAGTGSYEPNSVELVAVEPSSEMISQRKMGAHPAVKASAENLPFDDNSFSHAMTVNSIHHWSDRAQAFSEINRVAVEKFIAVTWDPQANPFWLTRDYFPEIYQMDLDIFPELIEFEQYFDDVDIRPLLIPANCQDGLLAAFWKRPAAYLNRQVRQATSPFSKIKNVNEGLAQLQSDITSGIWQKRNQSLLHKTSLDVGYRLITANVRKPEI